MVTHWIATKWMPTPLTFSKLKFNRTLVDQTSKFLHSFAFSMLKNMIFQNVDSHSRVLTIASKHWCLLLTLLCLLFLIFGSLIMVSRIPSAGPLVCFKSVCFSSSYGMCIPKARSCKERQIKEIADRWIIKRCYIGSSY